MRTAARSSMRTLQAPGSARYVVRTGRLGPAIVAHMVFNAIATVGLYADSVHRR